MSCTHSPKGMYTMCFGMAFGLSLIFIGINHYMSMGSGFAGMVSGGLGPLEPLGTLWAYIVPALQILGGLSFVSGMYMKYGALMVGVALGSIAAGMPLKAVIGGACLGGPGCEMPVMPAAQNALLWLAIGGVLLMLMGNCHEGK